MAIPPCRNGSGFAAYIGRHPAWSFAGCLKLQKYQFAACIDVAHLR